MKLEDIQELIKFVAKSGATEVDLEIDNIKISIKSPAKKEEEKTKTYQMFYNKYLLKLLLIRLILPKFLK